VAGFQSKQEMPQDQLFPSSFGPFSLGSGRKLKGQDMWKCRGSSRQGLVRKAWQAQQASTLTSTQGLSCPTPALEIHFLLEKMAFFRPVCLVA